MSRAELYSWASLTAMAAIFWWFQMRMLDGFTIVDQSASALLGVYVAILIACALAGVLIASLLAAITRGKSEPMDERDRAIEAQANLNERIVLIVAINIVIWQALMEGVFAGHKLPRLDLAHLPTLFFVLFTILFLGEAVKLISTIALYRLQAARG